MNKPFNTALIIPTGIGARIGGYGGDAMTLLPMLSEISDTVITHPNVANAACFQTLPENVLYVEGYALDQFFKGEWELSPVRQNKLGVIWDSGIEEVMEILHLNTIKAVQTVYGVDIIGLQKTAKPVDAEIIIEKSGRSSGKIKNTKTLIEAAEKLIVQGATALAVCCKMPELDEDNLTYKQGQGVDPIGGLEAMISHLLVAEFKLPVAHVPVFSQEDAQPADTLVDPRAASEFIVSTFLPCVLTGLAKAPQYNSPHPPAAQAPSPTRREGIGFIGVDMLDALVVPYNALGSVPVLSAIEKNIPVIAVLNNETVMNCNPEALGLKEKMITAQSYLEAIGYLVAIKKGITVPGHFMLSMSNNDVCLMTGTLSAS